MSTALKTLLALSLASAALFIILAFSNNANAGPRIIVAPSPVSGLDLGSGR